MRNRSTIPWMWWVVAAFGCRPAEGPPEVVEPTELEREVIPGSPIIQDPWPTDGVWLNPPVVVDLDGDGWLDLVGGQPSLCVAGCAQPASATYVNAMVAVWPGGPAGFPAAPTFVASTPDRYRDAVASEAVGDTDGNGVPEVLVADAFASNGSREEGKLWLAAGGVGALGPLLWTAEGGQPRVGFGSTVEALGDVNGDGYDDVMVGTLYGSAGQVVAFYGHPTGLRATPDWVSAPLGQSAGRGLAAGDLDADGYPDVFVGAPDAPAPSGDGQVFGFRGGPGGLSPNPDWTLTHAADLYSPAFGQQVLVVPDLNGDGYSELAVTARGFRVGNSQSGKVEIFEGGPAGPAPIPTWTFIGPEHNDTLGEGLAAGDLDGDGLTDLLMTIDREWYSVGGNWDGSGGALVVLGVPGGLSATPSYVLRGTRGAWCFHHSTPYLDDGLEHAVQVADLDRDGRDDVIFACAPSIPGTLGREGSTVIAYGGTDTDGDGVSDAMDCDASDPDIFPGAVEIGYDGVDQDCDGWDDFDLDQDGVQAVPWGFDEDDRDSAITLSLTVGGSCASALDLAVDGATSGGTVEFYAGIYAMYEGSFTAPHPCLDFGQGMNLREPELFLGSAVADASGRAELTGVAAWATACTDHVQAIDLATCGKSTAHTTPP